MLEEIIVPRKIERPKKYVKIKLTNLNLMCIEYNT